MITARGEGTMARTRWRRLPAVTEGGARMDHAAAKELIDRHAIETVECCFPDSWGVLTGRRMPAATFLRVAQTGMSTRLNSSHLGISYAVFCLKKKKDET